MPPKLLSSFHAFLFLAFYTFVFSCQSFSPLFSLSHFSFLYPLLSFPLSHLLFPSQLSFFSLFFSPLLSSPLFFLKHFLCPILSPLIFSSSLSSLFILPCHFLLLFLSSPAFVYHLVRLSSPLLSSPVAPSSLDPFTPSVLLIKHYVRITCHFVNCVTSVNIFLINAFCRGIFV